MPLSGRGEAAAASWEGFAAAWAERRAGLESDGGAGLALLLEPRSSPTQARLLAALRERFPAARVVAWTPLGEAEALEAGRQLFGFAARPRYHLTEARTVLCLDCDLFSTEAEALRHTREWAAARSPDRDDWPRLFAVESAPSLTGANADHRLALRAGEIPGFLAAVAIELQRAGVVVPGVTLTGAAPALPEEVARRARLVARRLAEAGSRALIAAGAGQPAAVHALAAAIHAGLGALG